MCEELIAVLDDPYASDIDNVIEALGILISRDALVPILSILLQRWQDDHIRKICCEALVYIKGGNHFHLEVIIAGWNNQIIIDEFKKSITNNQDYL